MGDEQERTMYVGNLHEDVTDALLYELFLQAGPLQSIKRVKDRETGRLKNFAFVVFMHAASVPYAIHLTNGIKLFGRPLKSQQRNNIDLPHYLSVGVHSIESESELQRTLSGCDGSWAEDDPKVRNSSGSHKNGRYDNSGFRPKPLDPNQVWKNNIDFNAQQQANHYVSNAMMMSSSSHMMPDYNQKSSGRSPSNSFSGGSVARSASHYHQMSCNILDQMGNSSGSGDVRSRLGNSNYRSTRDDRSGSSRSFDGSDDGDRRYNRAGGNVGYSPYDVNMRSHSSSSASHGSRYYNSGADARESPWGGGYVGPERMQHRIGGSPQDGRHRSNSYDNRNDYYRNRR